ncbi:FliH/SctL family protein [Herbivorax sp. ANBcel31]|uniref:FliH/SctL family protein n=1 Tax=Herbivorax sp. ANBcel31 TaxID=3069754 RepID=UPI0027B56A87|nr:FliH/SctL family protein [Herbivorax sp. ANBcel31]MDQ2085895.1 FliH/SctL family protein [Herbivorax sp. ANBcel31]
MYNKVFKSNQINVGVPVQIRKPVNYHNIKKLNDLEFDIEKNEDDMNKNEDYDELIERAKEEAETIIKEAEIEAVKLIEAAQIEGDKLKESIEIEAREEGLKKGYDEGKEEYKSLLEEAESIKKNAEKEYREVMNGIEKDAVNVILDIAKKVIGEQVSLNKENIFEILRKGFEKCSNKDDVIIKVSPKDHDFAVRNREKILSLIEGVGKLDIKKDSSLEEGACMIETPYGTVDAGVSTKLKKIENAFTKLIGKKVLDKSIEG